MPLQPWTASSGSALSGSWNADWVGGWNLGKVDVLLPCHYEGGAGNADISEIDAAIDAVSAQRAALGAVQNRLEYSLDNVSIYQENLVSAESRIRDVDMAAETVTLTKNQILAQAGTAMLAQANQAGQGVLSLLR